MKTLITCHSNADFDAFASLIGASLLYPHSIIFFPGTQEANLQRYIDEVASKHFTFYTAKDIDFTEVSKLIIVDTRQKSRVDHVKVCLEAHKRRECEIIVWDHHPSLEGEDIEADILYYEEVGATVSLLVHELKKQGAHLDKYEATLLMLGIHTDTGSFTYSSTKEKDFNAATLLWKWKQREQEKEEKHFIIDTLQLRQYLKTELTPMHIKALNELLENAQRYDILNISLVIAFAETGDYIHDFALLAPKIMEMLSCKTFFALARMDNKIQILARSSLDDLDVGLVCSKFGGGGHSYAASATAKNMTIAELKDTLVKEIYVLLTSHTSAKELLSSPVISVYEDSSMTKASLVMARYGLKALPVLEKKTSYCIGWISHEEAARASALSAQSPVELYMHKDFKLVDTKASLQELMDIIIGSKQRLLPVVEHLGEKTSEDELKKRPLKGVITRTDLIHLFANENIILPIPSQSKKKKSRNLSKVLADKLDSTKLLKLIGALAEEMGYNVSLVGGFVRDILLDIKFASIDLDLVVEGDGLLFAKELAKKVNGIVREHKPFMTASVYFSEKDFFLQNSEKNDESLSQLRQFTKKKNKISELFKIDIATARLEYYESPAALPTVEFSSLKMDLYRRDFTINAMAIRLNTKNYGMLVDFFNGQIDIRNQKIRILHTLSFIEDPTRILRAIRFEQRYNFKIGQHTEKLIQNAVDIQLIDKLSGRRIVAELDLIFKEEDSYKYVKRIEEYNIFAAIHKILKFEHNKESFIYSLLDTYEWYKKLYLEEVDGLLLLLLGLMRSATLQDTKEVLERLELTQKRRDAFLELRAKVIALYKVLEKWTSQDNETSKKMSDLYALLYSIPVNVVLYCIARTEEEELKKALTQYIYKWRYEKVDINGHDLKNLGVKEGKIYKEALLHTLYTKLDSIYEGKDFDREAQLKCVKEFLSLST